jgi:hypothetical protein
MEEDTIVTSSPRIATPGVAMMKETLDCVCALLLVSDEFEDCMHIGSHECICNMGPECHEICKAENHMCSCNEVTPETCRMYADVYHDCSCRVWGEESCRFVHHQTIKS